MRLTEAAALALAVNADLFAGALALAAQGIRIPRRARFVSAAVTSLAVCVGALGGAALGRVLPQTVLRVAAAVLLCGCGIGKLFDCAVRERIRKAGFFRKNYDFSLCGLRLMLSICADPQRADRDCSHSLSGREAAVFALSFAPDALISALGWGRTQVLLPGAAAFLLTLALMPLPEAVGRRFSRRMRRAAPFFGAGLLCALGLWRLLG